MKSPTERACGACLVAMVFCLVLPFAAAAQGGSPPAKKKWIGVE